MRPLEVNRVQLLNLIDPNDAFITELARAECITWSQRDHIVNIGHQRHRSEKLLKFIARRSVADFKIFINCLPNQQEHLVPLLQTDGGKTFISFWEQAYSQHHCVNVMSVSYV